MTCSQIILEVAAFNGPEAGGEQRFAKFVTLVQFYELSMFPWFIVSDANYHSITCDSNPLLWPIPRCNEDPDCRNPRGFRIATYIHTYIHTRVTETSKWREAITPKPS